jgi:hypothetical protein
MEHVFAIHDELGRFFDERVYKQELSARMSGVALEVPITVSFDGFSKLYYLDALVGAGALFEFKAVEAIHPRLSPPGAYSSRGDSLGQYHLRPCYVHNHPVIAAQAQKWQVENRPIFHPPSFCQPTGSR